MNKTFWLYHGERVLTAVRLKEGASDQEAIRRALYWHEKNPCIGPAQQETPAEFKNKLHHAEVRTFPNG